MLTKSFIKISYFVGVLLANKGVLSDRTSIENAESIDRSFHWDLPGCFEYPEEGDPELTRYLNEMENDGYSFMTSENYYSTSSKNFQNNLEEIRSTFAPLKLDPYSPGHRYRAYGAYFFNKNACSFDWIDVPHYQPTAHNPVDGEKRRVFDPIDDRLYTNPIFKALIRKNAQLIKHSGMVKFNSTLLMKILQIRYSPTIKEPAFSTPAWLHIDSEPITAAHLIDVSENLIGGDTIIAQDMYARNLTKVIRLKNPLDSYMVTQNVFHAVTPMGTDEDRPAHRSIFIIHYKNFDEEELKMLNNE